MSYPLLDVRIPGAYNQIYQELTSAIEKAEHMGDPPIAGFARSAQVCLDAVHSLKDQVLREGFKDKASEITFFKIVKPLFVRWLLYYQQLYQFEKRKPVGGKEAEIKYYEKKMLALETHYEEHAELYQYLRENATHQDELYYMRQETPNPLNISTVKADADPKFCTPMDYQTAVILKNALMEDYIVRALERLRGTRTVSTGDKVEDELFWTGPVNGLGLLLRTLVKAGYINNGNVTMTKVVERTEDFLHVKMNNFNRAIQETRIKKDPFEFFKGLIKVSQADFDSLDDNPRFS